jgi:uncharacterized protein (TIGR03086 family)
MNGGVLSTSMSANLRNYTKALYAFDHVMKLTDERTWSRKAPFAGWNGANIYTHVMDQVKQVHSQVTVGKNPKGSMKLGADPYGAWAKLRDQTLEALDHPGALQKMAHEPFGADFGSFPIDAFVGFMVAELVPHAWDLARTAKVDDRLDQGLCTITLATWKTLPKEVLRGPGFFGPAITPPKGADAQARMLAFVGRTA